MVIGEAEFSRVALLEGDVEVGAFGPAAGEADEVARAVDTVDVVESAAREFEAMASLAATYVEDAVVRFEGRFTDEEVDVPRRVGLVLDDVAVGFEVEGVEEGAPPVGREVAFEV